MTLSSTPRRLETAHEAVFDGVMWQAPPAAPAAAGRDRRRDRGATVEEVLLLALHQLAVAERRYREVRLGLGRIVALHHRSSTSYQIR